MDEDKNKEQKGFKGLSDLASDVNKKDLSKPQKDFQIENPKPTSASTKTPSTTKHEPPSSPTKPPPPSSSKPLPPSPPSPPKPSGGGSAWKWIVGILIFFFIIVILAYEEEDYSQPPSSRQTTQSSAPQQRVTASPPVTSRSQSTELQFEKPPAGNNNVLSLSQLRWCIREDIIFEAIRDPIDTNLGIEGFNRLVDDYNRRCSSFRYREGTLQRARREVEANRLQIESAAIQKALNSGWISSGSGPSRTTTPSTDSQHVREAQRLLSELGYNPGPVDGIWGPRTERALREFQQDVGLRQDGVISQDILSLLRLIKENMTSVNAMITSSSSPPENQRSSGIPANASLNYFGNDWDCNRGYRKLGNECIPL